MVSGITKASAACSTLTALWHSLTSVNLLHSQAVSDGSSSLSKKDKSCGAGEFLHSKDSIVDALLSYAAYRTGESGSEEPSSPATGGEQQCTELSHLLSDAESAIFLPSLLSRKLKGKLFIDMCTFVAEEVSVLHVVALSGRDDVLWELLKRVSGGKVSFRDDDDDDGTDSGRKTSKKRKKNLSTGLWRAMDCVQVSHDENARRESAAVDRDNHIHKNSKEDEEGEEEEEEEVEEDESAFHQLSRRVIEALPACVRDALLTPEGRVPFLDQRDANGFTALHMAAVRNFPKMLEVLLLLGANPFSRVSCFSPQRLALRLNRKTPVFIAVEYGYYVCVEVLLDWYPILLEDRCATHKRTPLLAALLAYNAHASRDGYSFGRPAWHHGEGSVVAEPYEIAASRYRGQSIESLAATEECGSVHLHNPIIYLLLSRGADMFATLDDNDVQNFNAGPKSKGTLVFPDRMTHKSEIFRKEQHEAAEKKRREMEDADRRSRGTAGATTAASAVAPPIEFDPEREAKEKGQRTAVAIAVGHGCGECLADMLHFILLGSEQWMCPEGDYVEDGAKTGTATTDTIENIVKATESRARNLCEALGIDLEVLHAATAASNRLIKSLQRPRRYGFALIRNDPTFEQNLFDRLRLLSPESVPPSSTSTPSSVDAQTRTEVKILEDLQTCRMFSSLVEKTLQDRAEAFREERLQAAKSPNEPMKTAKTTNIDSSGNNYKRLSKTVARKVQDFIAKERATGDELLDIVVGYFSYLTEDSVGGQSAVNFAVHKAVNAWREAKDLYGLDSRGGGGRGRGRGRGRGGHRGMASSTSSNFQANYSDKFRLALKHMNHILNTLSLSLDVAVGAAGLSLKRVDCHGWTPLTYALAALEPDDVAYDMWGQGRYRTNDDTPLIVAHECYGGLLWPIPKAYPPLFANQKDLFDSRNTKHTDRGLVNSNTSSSDDEDDDEEDEGDDEEEEKTEEEEQHYDHLILEFYDIINQNVPYTFTDQEEMRKRVASLLEDLFADRLISLLLRKGGSVNTIRMVSKTTVAPPPIDKGETEESARDRDEEAGEEEEDSNKSESRAKKEGEKEKEKEKEEENKSSRRAVVERPCLSFLQRRVNAELLISHGAEVDVCLNNCTVPSAKATAKVSPLNNAFSETHTTFFRFDLAHSQRLLDSGFNTSLTDIYGLNVFGEALHSKDWARVTLLLNEGADLNVPDWLLVRARNTDKLQALRGDSGLPPSTESADMSSGAFVSLWDRILGQMKETGANVEYLWRFEY